MDDYMKVKDDELHQTWSGEDIGLPVSNENDAIVCEQNLSITDILGPVQSVVDEGNRNYERIGQTAVQLSGSMKRLVPNLTPDDFGTVVMYHQTLEHMRSRSFPDGKTVLELFPAVTMRYFSLNLSDSQRDNLVGAYESAKNYAKPEVQKKLIE